MMRTTPHIAPAGRNVDEQQRRRRLATGGGSAPKDENGDRHAQGVNSERPPRPLGVAPGAAWEPRNPTRSFAAHSLTYRFLEALEAAPWLQDVAVSALRLVSPLLTRPEGPPPADVADEPGSWRLAAIGDYGAGTKHLANVARNLAASGAKLVITTGDNVYPTGRWQDYQRNWEPSMGAVARSRNFMPALGNHDMYKDDLRPYFGHFPHLKGQTYYTFTQNNAQLFALDGDQDIRPGSAQRAWLEQSLKESKSPWKIVYLHYPMFGSSAAPNEISESVQPLLEKHGVQLVVAGHEHNYLRAKPIGGVTHILTGGGGQRVYPFTKAKAEHLERRSAAYHHLELSVGARKLIVRAVDEDGTRIDTVEIPVNATQQARRAAAMITPVGQP